MQRPTMSRSLGTNSGSRDSLNCRTRCGWSPWARQMRCTEDRLIPTALAMAAPVQWVVSPGASVWVSATTRSATAGGSGATRDGRVLSRNSPSTPSCMNRSCQRHRRSEEHTSELQSRFDLVCRLLLEKKKHTCFDFEHINLLYARTPKDLLSVSY